MARSGPIPETRLTPERGVSTVVDVALALLLITASVAIVGHSLADAGDETPVRETGDEATIVADGEHDPQSAAQTTETLGETTIAVTYSIEDVRNEDEFSEPVITNANTYRRTDHGPSLGLLADAAIANYRIGGESVLAYGEEYEDAVDWAIRHRLLGAERNVYVVAEWEPYEGAGINGTATVGERPPATADVSSTTTTVSSGFSELDAEELEANWIANASEATGTDNNSYAAAGAVIGAAIVEGLFPPAETQYALEDQGIDRELAVYRYRSTVAAIGDFSFRHPDTHPPLVRSEARAVDANHRVLVGQDGGYDVTDADALAAWIAADVPRAFEDEFDAIDEEYDGDERAERKVETVVEALAIDDVTITVYTWHE